MKRKILVIGLSLILLIGLTGCGNNEDNNNPRDNKMTIIDNDNKTVNMSINELYDISKENEAKFQKYYLGAKVSFDGVISNVEVDDSSCKSSTSFVQWQSGKESITGTSYGDKTPCAKITFKGGIYLYIPNTLITDIAEISNGDKYHVESNLIYFWANNLFIYGVTDSGAIEFYETKLQKI